MGIALLDDVLREWDRYNLDDELYLPIGAEPSLGMYVSVLSFDPTRGRVFEQQEYLLGIEQVRDVIIGLESQLGRTTTILERLRAVVHYAHFDAFIDPKTLTA